MIWVFLLGMFVVRLDVLWLFSVDSMMFGLLVLLWWLLILGIVCFMV